MGDHISMVLADFADDPTDSFSDLGRGVLEHFEKVFEAREQDFLKLLAVRSFDDSTEGDQSSVPHFPVLTLHVSAHEAEHSCHNVILQE